MLDWPTPDAATEPEFRPGNLEAKFVAPPFSVLDTRQGYWQERRREWLSLGIKSELGRAEAVFDSGAGREMQPGHGNYRSDGGLFGTNGKPSLLQKGVGPPRAFTGGTMPNATESMAENGTSIFDPVLCELAYRWFCPPDGSVLDPFAGGSVRGIVAAKLGHEYAGLDLSERQVVANREQARLLLTTEPQPNWYHADSRVLDAVIPLGRQFDLIFTCPPYFDLEVYSDTPGDLSNAADYATFMAGYREIIATAARRLRPDRFAVIVVSEIRDKDGYCRGFVPDTIRAAEDAGLRLYNEAILVNSAGSLPLRVTKYMESSRKLGRAHQNVLVFLKGAAPRGWSYDREPPPKPQLSMFGDVA